MLLLYLSSKETFRTDDLVKNVFAYVTVYSAKRIVQKVNFHVAVDGAGQTDSLLLTTTQINSLKLIKI